MHGQTYRWTEGKLVVYIGIKGIKLTLKIELNSDNKNKKDLYWVSPHGQVLNT